MQKNRTSIARSALFVGMLLILFAWLINNLPTIGSVISKILEVLNPFIIGAFIAYLLYWPVSKLEHRFAKNRLFNRWKPAFRRCVAMAIVYVLTIATTVLLLYAILPEIVRSLGMLVNRIQPTADVVTHWIADMLKRFNIPQSGIASVFSSIQSLTGTLLSSIGNIAAGAYTLMLSFLTGAFNLGLGILISIYMLYGREALGQQAKKALYAFCKLNAADTLFSILRRSNQIFSIFLYVRIFCSILVGVVTYVVLAPFHFSYVVLISVICGVFNLIPIFGPIIAAILCSLLLFIANPAQMIWFLLFSVVLQQVEGNIIEPKMMGDRMGLPILWVLFGVLVGGGFFGAIGMLIGVPVVAIAYSLMQAFIESRLIKREVDVC